MNPPDTVTEAVAFLASKGYVDDFRLSARRHHRCEHQRGAPTAVRRR